MRVDNPTAAPVNTQVFGPGDHTWVMPTGARLVQVCLIAAGGGGTSGWRGTPADFTTVGPGTNGSGGEGGGWAIMTFPAANLTGQVAVTVGVGGVGDTAAASDGGFGTGATDGGATSFGGYLTVAGGRYPLTTEARPVIGSMITPGGASSADAAGCPAGGFGGSMQLEDSGIVTNPATQGGRSTLTTNPAAAAGVTDGVLDGEDGFSQPAGQPMPGSAGGGGAASQFSPAGNGGNGGNYGAGGGGGGASGDGYPAGNGGHGGDGIAVITTYF